MGDGNLHLHFSLEYDRIRCYILTCAVREKGVELMNLKSDLKPITYLKNNTADLVRDVSQSGRTMLITQNGEAKVVVMDVETYSRWRDALALMKMISQGEADADSGRLIPQDEAFARAEKAIGRATGDE